jgi:hypothetical protein
MENKHFISAIQAVEILSFVITIVAGIVTVKLFVDGQNMRNLSEENAKLELELKQIQLKRASKN